MNPEPVNPIWKQFLSTRDSTREDSAVASANVPSGREAGEPNWLADLSSSIGILSVTGADASEFLQAQFCNDLTTIQGPGANGPGAPGLQLNGYCSPKGRLLGLFWIYQHGENEFRLLVSRDLTKSLSSRLSMFVLRSKVEIKDVSGEMVAIAAAGPGAEATVAGLSELAGKVPLPSGVVLESSVAVLALPLLEPAYVLLADPETAQSLWEQLAGNLIEVDANRWELACVRAGVPTVSQPVADKLIPQMLNMQAINGLSFKKGCYPGQEIVARMQYLGKLKRNMRLLSFKGHIPAVGQSIQTPDDADAGLVVRVAETDAAEALALVVMKISVAVSDVQLETDNAVEINEIALPYSLEV